jgi:hypothetical protein
MKTSPSVAAALTLLALAAPARAADEGIEPPPSEARQSVEAGLLLPTTLPAAVGVTPAVVTALGGYDGARHGAALSAVADIRVWGPLAVRLGASYLPQSAADERTMQPQVGLRLQVLDQGHHGLDAGVGLLFKRDRYSYDGGEVELAVMAARRLGRLGMFANAALGQDPEGDDREGTINAAALYGVGPHLQLGVDARVRFDVFSSDGRRSARGEPGLDLAAGPTAAVPVGPVAFVAQLGYSVLRLGGRTEGGLLALGGLARAF